MTRTKMMQGTTLLAMTLGLAAMVMFGTGQTTANAPVGIDASRHIPAASQIVTFDGQLWRLDTTTGALYRLRGNLDNASTRNSWELRAAPVTGDVSGMLEIQRVRNIAARSDSFKTIDNEQRERTFLVDINYGTTWILQHRASGNLSWDRIDIFR